MFKRLLATLLAVAVLSTSILAVELTTEAYEEETIEDCCQPEYTVSIVGAVPIPMPMPVAPIPSGAVFASAGVSEVAIPMPGWGWEEPAFDDVIDRLYFIQFRDGFEFARRHSTDINKTVTYGDLEMEVISSIAIAGHSNTWRNWLGDEPPFTFDEETGAITINEDAEYEDIEVQSVEVHTFFSLRDFAGDVNFTWGTQIGLLEDFDALFTGVFPQMHGNVRSMFVDEETGIAYFIVSHSAFVEVDAESISMDFTINSIMSDQRHSSEEIAIDFADILANHEASFTTEYVNFGGSTSGLYELFGADFDPLANDAERLVRNELNIHVFENIYLTNLAVRDNLLLIQTREPVYADFPAQRSAHVSLINTSVDNIFHLNDIFPDLDFDNLDEAGWNEVWEQIAAMPRRFMNSIYNVDVHELDENFMPVDDIRVSERAYHLTDPAIINYLAFSASLSYFGFVQELNLAVSFEVPIQNFLVRFNDAEVEIMGDMYILSEIQVNFMDIRFSVDGEGELVDMMGGRAGIMRPRIPMSDAIEIVLVFADGTEEPYQHFTSGTSMRMSTDMQAVEELSMNFGGSVIDVENLVALRINGVLIESK